MFCNDRFRQLFWQTRNASDPTYFGRSALVPGSPNLISRNTPTAMQDRIRENNAIILKI
jgi:hypothetical protein